LPVVFSLTTCKSYYSRLVSPLPHPLSSKSFVTSRKNFASLLVTTRKKIKQHSLAQSMTSHTLCPTNVSSPYLLTCVCPAPNCYLTQV
jgi:hypothetical protein